MKGMLTIFLTLCLWLNTSHAQDRYKTTGGEVSINASTPLEDIYALNNSANAILDPATGKFAVVMLIKEFEFDRKLMQEHFNENYMESDKFPKATFAGILVEFNQDTVGQVNTKYKLEGNLSIHGVTRPLNTIVQISGNGRLIKLESDFMVRSEDHGITVPQLVFKKIATEVQVKVSLELRAQ